MEIRRTIRPLPFRGRPKEHPRRVPQRARPAQHLPKAAKERPTPQFAVRNQNIGRHRAVKRPPGRPDMAAAHSMDDHGVEITAALPQPSREPGRAARSPEKAAPGVHGKWKFPRPRRSRRIVGRNLGPMAQRDVHRRKLQKRADGPVPRRIDRSGNVQDAERGAASDPRRRAPRKPRPRSNPGGYIIEF